MAQAKPEQSQLLIPFSTTPMAAVERFVVAEVIKIGAKIGDYTIVEIGPNFRRHFLDPDHPVVEENVPARDLPSHTLAEYSRDEPIINALGGTLKDLGPAQTALAHLFGVIPLGKTGPGIFRDWIANIGYKVSPVTGEPMAVRWRVSDDELRVLANPASRPVGWDGGYRVFGG